MLQSYEKICNSNKGDFYMIGIQKISRKKKRTSVFYNPSKFVSLYHLSFNNTPKII